MSSLEHAKDVLKDCRKRLKDHLEECDKCTRYVYCGIGQKLQMRVTDQQKDVRIALRRVQYRNGERTKPS